MLHRVTATDIPVSSVGFQVVRLAGGLAGASLGGQNDTSIIDCLASRIAAFGAIIPQSSVCGQAFLAIARRRGGVARGMC